MVEHQYLFCTMFVLQLIVQDMFFLKITADSLSQPHVEMHNYVYVVVYLCCNMHNDINVIYIVCWLYANWKRLSETPPERCKVHIYIYVHFWLHHLGCTVNMRTLACMFVWFIIITFTLMALFALVSSVDFMSTNICQTWICIKLLKFCV